MLAGAKLEASTTQGLANGLMKNWSLGSRRLCDKLDLSQLSLKLPFAALERQTKFSLQVASQ